jgi:hypothetical protein
MLRLPLTVTEINAESLQNKDLVPITRQWADFRPIIILPRFVNKC